MLHTVACCLILFNRGVAKRKQHFVQHDTTFFQIYLPARVQQSTTKLHGVAKRVQHYTTSRKTKEKLYHTTFV